MLPFLQFSILLLIGQHLNPVTWDFKASQVEDAIYEVRLVAKMEKNWAIYSQFMEEGGPIPTEVSFDDEDSLELLGKTVEEGKLIEGHDPLFNITVAKFKNKVTFKQRVRLTKEVQTISGSVTFLTCDHNRCLPPKTVRFSITL
jgi:hypothetical protein